MRSYAVSILAVIICMASPWANADEFFGYHTRLDYTIQKAKDYIPTELTAESRSIIERMEALEMAAVGEGVEDEEDSEDDGHGANLESIAFDDLPAAVRKEARRQYPDKSPMAVETERDGGQVFFHVMFEVNGAEAGLKMNPQGDVLDRWVFLDEGQEDGGDDDDKEDEQEDDETPGRRGTNRSNALTGRYADVVIQVSDGQKLVFSRKTAYQPVWQTAKGEWPIEDIVNRQFDIGCLYSFARIIEHSPTMIKVHWRYMPDLNDVGPTKVVHEMFVITPEGDVERRIRQACADLDDWNDAANVTVQQLKLTADGIEELSVVPAQLSRLPKKPVAGTRVKSDHVAQAAAVWDFDEGLEVRSYSRKDITKERILGTDCAVEGDVTLWKKGVSGTALAFDGYKSRVACPAAEAPVFTDELTIEAWVALGALPWNWAPLIHQSIVDPGPIEKGNYDEFGKTDPA